MEEGGGRNRLETGVCKPQSDCDAAVIWGWVSPLPGPAIQSVSRLAPAVPYKTMAAYSF